MLCPCSVNLHSSSPARTSGVTTPSTACSPARRDWHTSSSWTIPPGTHGATSASTGDRVDSGGMPRLTYSGIGVYRPELFAGRASERHPLLPILEEAIGRGEASGEHYRGRWFNVGTPDDLAALDRALRSRAAGHAESDGRVTAPAIRFSLFRSRVFGPIPLTSTRSSTEAKGPCCSR